MAGDVVDVVRRWFAALERGDPAPEMCDPDIEIVNWAEAPSPGPYFGHDGLRQWWADIADSFEGVRVELTAVDALDGERAVTAQRLVGTFRLTGIELDVPWGSVISVRDGRILAATGYSSPARARRAAGLE